MHHEFDTQASNGGFIAGVLCGAALGAALGVLLAPKAGSETRRQLAASSGRLRDGANRTYHRATEGVNHLMSRGREAVDRGREAYGRTREGSTTTPAEAFDDTFGKPSFPTA